MKMEHSAIKTNEVLTYAGAVVIGGLVGMTQPNLPLIPEDQHIPDHLIDLALSVAVDAHRNQKRWDGQPYITHPKAVASTMQRRFKVFGWLHDVMEDNGAEYPLSRMQVQFPPWIVERLVVLTKLKDEPYDEYILRILVTRDWAIWSTKQEDLRHNLSTSKPGAMRDKYRLALRMLGETPL